MPKYTWIKWIVDQLSCKGGDGGDKNAERHFYMFIFVYEHLLGAFMNCLITTVVQVTVQYLRNHN